MAGTLYLIPNTLGLRDAADPLPDVIPAGVQQITARLDYFVAEHAKTARALLKKLAETTPLARPLQEITIRELNVKTPASELEALLAPVIAGQDAGLMSEAGVPAVADPGANLVRLAHRHGVRVKPLVGPSSILLAVMASGLNGQSFAFNGKPSCAHWNRHLAQRDKPRSSSKRPIATARCWKPSRPPARRARCCRSRWI
jgi:16S rRNA (cytidine1402-2'-O)-methyltransferase